MSFSRRQLEKLIDEIRQKNVSLDEAYAGILKRWRDNEQAIDALRDILARAEKTYGLITESVVVGFIDYVLKIKWYDEKMDGDIATLVKLHRKKKRTLPKERTLLMRAFRKRRISSKDFIKRMTELDHIECDSPSQPPVRSSTGGSRIRTLFMRDLSAAVHEDASVWMDEQVAAIASVVFKCEIDKEQVRNTRRH